MSDGQDEHLVSIYHCLTELLLNRKHVKAILPRLLSIRYMTAIPSPENGKQTSMRLVEISTWSDQDAWNDQGVSGHGIWPCLGHISP